MGSKQGLFSWHVLPHNLTQITWWKQQLFANVKSALGDQKYIDFKQKDPK